MGLHASGPFGHPADPGKPTLGIKMFVTVSDQDEEMGCTSFVPGSHRIAEEPRSIWRNGVVSEEEGGGAFDAQARLPHVRFAGRAGDAMLMDLRTWHTAMPNTTDRDRETLIISFNDYIVKGMEGSTLGVWVAHGEGQATFPHAPVLERVLAKGLAPIRYVDDANAVTEVPPGSKAAPPARHRLATGSLPARHRLHAHSLLLAAVGC